MSRQFRTDDTSYWGYKYGWGSSGAATLSGTYGAGTGGWLGACSGTSGSTSLTTPAGWGLGTGGWACIIHQTQGSNAGVWEINHINNISGTTSTLTYALQNTYSTGAQCVLMLPYTGITVSGTLTAPAWDGSTGGIIALLGCGTATISGTITATGKGYRGVASYTWGGDRFAHQGEGYTSYGGDSRAANTSGGGGGIGDSGSSDGGGGGGHATSGGLPDTADHNDYGIPGTAGSDNAALTVAQFGGAGGAGGTSDDSSRAGGGGSGGGFIILITKFITISGTVVANGNDGGDTTPGGANDSAGGGGGAGGSVLIKSQIATLGTNKITVAAGAAGTEDYGGPGGNGGAGAVGRIHLDYLTSYTGSATNMDTPTQHTALAVPKNRGVIII